MEEFVENDFDFDEESKPQELNYIQKAILNCNEELEDGVEYDATLVRVEASTLGSDIPVVNYIYEVNNIEVTDTYFFSEKAIKLSISRLKDTLQKFGYSLRVEDAIDGTTTIANSTRCLVGTEVKIIQSTRTSGEKSYKNYNVVSVTMKNV